MPDIQAQNSSESAREEPGRADRRAVNAGQIVRFGTGPLAGIQGVVVDRRASGQYLVELSQGVFVETNPSAFDALNTSTGAESA